MDNPYVELCSMTFRTDINLVVSQSASSILRHVVAGAGRCMRMIGCAFSQAFLINCQVHVSVAIALAKIHFNSQTSDDELSGEQCSAASCGAHFADSTSCICPASRFTLQAVATIRFFSRICFVSRLSVALVLAMFVFHSLAFARLCMC